MATRTALLLINKKSRQGDGDLGPVLDVLRAGGLALIEPSADEPWKQAVAASRGRVDLAVVGGGDGTLNTVVEALVETGLPLGILPLGTANDLARTLDLPTDPAEAASVIVEGRTRRIDLGCVNGKYFFNVASLGLSIQVTHELSGDTKRRWGVLGYPLALWRAIRKRRAFRADVRCDEVRRRLHSIQIWIGNGRYFGGGMTIAMNARIDDGKLDLVSLAPRGFWQLILSSPALWWGHHHDERIRHWRGTEIVIHTHRSMPINTDGEVTTQTPAHVHIVPEAIAVYVP